MISYLQFTDSCFRHHRTSRSPLSRGIVRGANGFLVRTRVDVPCSRLRKYDNPVRSDDITGK